MLTTTIVPSVVLFLLLSSLLAYASFVSNCTCSYCIAFNGWTLLEGHLAHSSPAGSKFLGNLSRTTGKPIKWTRRMAVEMFVCVLFML